MASPCGRWRIVFNGEIYNHHDLRVRLEAEGHRFRGSGDTEVLLAWMASRGQAGLGELRGMFAFALVDSHTGTALLARDPHGIKPLYLWQGPAGAGLRLGTAGLARQRPHPRRADPAAIAAYLASGSVPEPATLVAGCGGSRPATGCNGRGAVHSEPWLPLPEALLREHGLSGATSTAAIGDREAAIALSREALRESVTAHMVSDVPVGLFLSAGLDSAALLALAPGGSTPSRSASMNPAPQASTNRLLPPRSPPCSEPPTRLSPSRPPKPASGCPASWPARTSPRSMASTPGASRAWPANRG